MLSWPQVALYASSQQIPDRSLVGDIVSIYLDNLYFTKKPSSCDNGTDNGSVESLSTKSPKPKRKTGALSKNKSDAGSN